MNQIMRCSDALCASVTVVEQQEPRKRGEKQLSLALQKVNNPFFVCRKQNDRQHAIFTIANKKKLYREHAEHSQKNKTYRRSKKSAVQEGLRPKIERQNKQCAAILFCVLFIFETHNFRRLFHAHSRIELKQIYFSKCAK